MKKSIAPIMTILIAGALCFNACGPSAKEKEAEKVRIQDSISSAEAKMAAELERQADSIEMAIMKAKEDSLKAALEAEISKPKAPAKPKGQPTKPETRPAGTGRG